jgi:hypothetical protein
MAVEFTFPSNFPELKRFENQNHKMPHYAPGLFQKKPALNPSESGALFT